MALPSDLYTVAVTASFKDAGGAALPGTVTFTLSALLADGTGNVVIPAYPKPYTLSAGALTAGPLVANDNADLLPTGSTYLVTVALQNLQQYSYYVQLLAAPLSFTATSATPCVFTAAGSSYANGTAVTLTGGSLPAGFTAATTYYVVSASGTSFSLAATSGGSAIASTGTGSGTVSTASVDLADLQPVVPQGTPVSYVPTSGGTYTGTVVLDGSPALQIPSGAAAGQVLTSDASGNGVWAAPALVVKPEVQEATAAALPANAYLSGVLTASSNGALTVDGIAVSLADRVLVKNEVTAANNGVYVVTATGASGAKYVLTRSADMSIAADIPGAFIFVQQGTNNGNTGWMVTGAGPWTLGSTAISWAQFSAVPAIGLLTPTATKTANYTAVSGDMVKTDTSGGSFTVTLPSAPPVNTTIGVKQIAVAGLGTNATTVTCGGSDVLNKSAGPTSMTLDRLNQTVIMQYGTGGIWTVQATDPAVGQIATARQGVYYLDSYTGTDDAKMASALAAVFAASPAGGTIVLSPRTHTFVNQWATTYSSGVVTALKIQGAGVAFNGTWGTPSAATVCDMQYAGGGAARIDMQHIGTIEITGCLFEDTVASTVPFFQTTNTTPNLHDNVWSGNASVSGITCYQDAIVLGGTATSGNSGDNAPYQGYQGQIYRNFFHRIRRACYFRSAANSAQFHDNTVAITCGSNLYLGACVEFLGPNSSTYCTGNAVYGNCLEIQNYPVGVKATSFTQANTLGPNGFFDAGASTVACYWFDDAGTGRQNEVIDGYHSAALIYDPANANTLRSPQTGTTSYYNSPVSFRNTMLVANGGAGPVGMDSSGNRGAWAVSAGVSLANPALTAQVTAPTQVTDGSTVSTSNIVTSLTAAWAAADIGDPITAGANLPSGTFIQWAYTATTALPWQASTAYTAGQVVRPGTANAHLYQVTTAGTTASSAPTFPTGGGTVTDGTVVWTDIGAATAALVSHTATATNTGLTTTFGRASGSAISMTSFASHHVLSSGSAPAALALTNAGGGATASLTGTDIAHLLTLNTGTSPIANGSICGATYALPFPAQPKGISIAPGSATAAALMAGGYWLTSTTTAWSLQTVSAPPASTSGLLFFITVIK